MSYMIDPQGKVTVFDANGQAMAYISPERKVTILDSDGQEVPHHYIWSGTSWVPPNDRAPGKAREIIAKYAAEVSECLSQLSEIKANVKEALKPWAEWINVSERSRMVSDVYWSVGWRVDIPVGPLMVAFGIESVLPARLDTQCRLCAGDIHVRSHEHVSELSARFSFGDITSLYCRDCQEEKRQSRKRELRSMPYAEYLRSPEWQETRAAAMERSGHRCQLCGQDDPQTVFDVHHNTYENLGEELPIDLIVLCRRCHTIHHAVQL